MQTTGWAALDLSIGDLIMAQRRLGDVGVAVS